MMAKIHVRIESRAQYVSSWTFYGIIICGAVVCTTQLSVILSRHSEGLLCRHITLFQCAGYRFLLEFTY
ncbi:hypothetical protein M431DRAFT_210571 [Trichoderma harzianum CBS 226.95]|uniref:Uncharacterized protein n=1 Tax=Trichoderma harzianum CBS 226.95 TaxID=983964 RepID=A0A2T4A4Y3_TRIHA|nr:hypothetical protein M431DRAFT_210571 [Trichoderma harzianum CBS 226.95]PTB52098.1 hypothetical protein M431DRAFT_210571 [Trichoderma harzianum CBS 226.95]